MFKTLDKKLKSNCNFFNQTSYRKKLILCKTKYYY